MSVANFKLRIIRRDAQWTAAMAEEEGHQTARKKVDPSFIGNSSTNHNRAGLLKELRALNVTAKELVNEGYSLDTLKIAGYSMKELVGAGFTLDQLFQANVSKGLRASGFHIRDLRKSGYEIKEFKKAGYSAKELRT